MYGNDFQYIYENSQISIGRLTTFLSARADDFLTPLDFPLCCSLS